MPPRRRHVPSRGRSLRHHRHHRVPTTSSTTLSNQNRNLAGVADWQQNDSSVFMTEDYSQPANYGYYGSDPAISSDTSTFQTNCSSNNFSFQSVLSNISSPSSSPTPLSSGSNYHMTGGGSTEDERESYCSNMLKFEIPTDVLDIADLI